MDITLTVMPGMDPVPAVAVAVSLTSADIGEAVAVTVERVTDEGAAAVRGGYRVTPTTSVSVLDVEAPFNIELAYRVVFIADNGEVISYSDTSDPIVLPHTGTVIHQVLQPAQALEVELLAGAGLTHEREFFGELVHAGSGPGVWLGSGRSGLQSLELSLFARTREQEERMGQVLSSDLPVLVYRSSAAQRLPQPFYMLVRHPLQESVNWHLGMEWTRWPWVVDEVRPPGLGLVVPLLTWADVAATYDTWDDVAAQYGSWSELMQDYSIAGAGS